MTFKLNVIQDYPIFKIPEYKSLRVFVTDTFKEAVEANGLKGFTFELLWDCEDNGDAEETGAAIPRGVSGNREE